MKNILILEGKSDQCKTLTEFLKNSKKFEIHTSPNICEKDYSGFDEVIPTGSNSTYKYINDFGDIKIGDLVFTKNNIETYDKIPYLNFIKDNSIPIPNTYINKNDLKVFPVFYKSLREEGYAERGIIRDIKEAENFNNPNVFFQEFIWSKGTYGVAFLADRGKLLTTFIQYELLSYPYHGGSGVILEHVEDKRLVEYTERIVRESNYSGWGLVEFKYSFRIEDYVFMEVNAKLWASIKFAFVNNPMFLKMLFDIDFKSLNLKRVMYIDRLILSEWAEIWKYLPYISKSKIVHSKPIPKTIINRLKGNRIKAQRVKLMK